MLDNGEFAALVELMTTDIVYEMPTRTSVMPKEGSGFHRGLRLLRGKPFVDDSFASSGSARARPGPSNHARGRGTSSRTCSIDRTWAKPSTQ